MPMAMESYIDSCVYSIGLHELPISATRPVAAVTAGCKYNNWLSRDCPACILNDRGLRVKLACVKHLTPDTGSMYTVAVKTL